MKIKESKNKKGEGGKVANWQTTFTRSGGPSFL
jgi:hypothetical protein